MGLLEEQTYHPSKALQHYERAFRAAPELADPRVNPDLMYSKLQLGAAMRQQEVRRFTETVPMPYLDESQVKATRARYLPTATPTPTPVATPSPSVRDRRTDRPVPSSTIQRGGETAGSGAEAGRSSSGGRVRPRPMRTAPTPAAESTESDSPYGVRRPDREPETTDPGGAGGYGTGTRSVSPQATIRPWWSTMPEWILLFV
jgi:hypothetical protein